VPVRSAAAQDRLPGTITTIVDGDTVKVHLDAGPTVTVRLTGIDTPETKHPTKPVQCFGVEASARTAELLPVGTVVGLERDVQDQDRYDRTLAYVWSADGTVMLNEQLVVEGYALTLTIPPNVKYAERFSAAAQGARENGPGLWTACAGALLEASDDAPATDDQVVQVAATAVPPAAPKPQAAPALAPAGNCHLSYPDFCIPPAPPDLNCTSPLIAGRKNFTVRQPDPHNFDADRDGVGCESRR
jgi:micrococcal nuclease